MLHTNVVNQAIKFSSCCYVVVILVAGENGTVTTI